MTVHRLPLALPCLYLNRTNDNFRIGNSQTSAGHDIRNDRQTAEERFPDVCSPAAYPVSMSTIASPRPSISSRRTSTSTDATASHSTALDRSTQRRNRTALRDYYNLKTADNPTKPPSSLASGPVDIDPESELDRPDFDPSVYVQTLLSTSSLENVLRAEAGLVSEIRNLDGEKKALVYDNYSKLIAATDTIKDLRSKMGPVSPETSELGTAIARIAETAGELSRQLRASNQGAGEAGRKNWEQRETVRWVLGAPKRLETMQAQGRTQEAEAEWEEVSGLLAQWSGVRGVEEVRNACLAMFAKPGG